MDTHTKCPGCVFLGEYHPNNCGCGDAVIDVWYCRKEHTVMLRFGDKMTQYASYHIPKED